MYTNIQYFSSSVPTKILVCQVCAQKIKGFSMLNNVKFKNESACTQQNVDLLKKIRLMGIEVSSKGNLRFCININWNWLKTEKPNLGLPN